MTFDELMEAKRRIENLLYWMEYGYEFEKQGGFIVSSKSDNSPKFSDALHNKISLNEGL